ncbi:oral-facial-digital syndrome 1 protein homolog isoform X1 [Cyprinodon tularosa]|uniref:oral-facial-digital syndrome 1 protein homolog isoform X1 n=1 Tax=Cyprinodon tularosa TaxID=77115 RepID=UPI0018E2467F|nr:oral-facial-digital syndrome 1 protein homolog isoform X1 [Cyprinodon tularosa]
MSSSKEDSLSPEELRKRLYRTFKNNGVLDRLKVQLRNQLIQELNHPLSRGQNPGPVPLNGTSETLLLSACNSMVADHLRTLGYEYTLSVFCPESGLSNDKILKKEDLLRILNLSPSSAIFTSMLNKENSDKGFLFSLLAGLAHHSTHSLRHDVDTQTTSLASYGESLVDKMKMIDKRYESLALGEDKIFPLQSKLSAYKKEIEAQKEAEMKAKLKHFKDVEIAKVRMEEKSKFNEEFEKLKQELERTYEMKAMALMEREKNAIERLQKQQEIEEKNIYMHRQSLLKEIETQRSRDNELRMRMEAFENSCQIHAEKVKVSEELLRRRELAVRTMEDTYDQKLKNELSRYQLELKEEFLKRTEKLTESENRNKVETARIQKESEMIDARLEEHQRACAELKRLQVELETAQQQISLLTQQKELLKERLESTSDYSSLKMEKAELLGQQQLLQKQLEEAQEENKRLHAEMMKPSKEELALHAELSRLKNTRTLDEVEFENQKQVLQAQLQREMEQCVYLKAQLTECEKRSEWMAKHVEEIKTQLRHTQQALENEVLRNPKPSLVDRSVLELGADKLVPPDIYMDGSVLRPRASYHDICEAGGPSRGHRSPWNDSPDSDFELVAEAKARVLELQKEAESLEEAYRKYQQRAVHTILSPRPLSPQQAYSSLYPSSLFRKKDYQDSHNYSSHKPKTLLNQLTPHYVQSKAMASNETRNILPAVHEQPQALFVSDHSPNSLSEPVSLKEGQRQKKQSVSAKRSPQSSSRGRLHKEHSEEPAVSLMPFSQMPLSDKPALFRASVTTPGDSSELSPPHSPQHRSTARDQSSPPKVELVFSSSASSPQPEKINLEDLTGELQESGHIPELLPDTAVPLSEEAPKRPTTPQPQDLPEDPTYSQTQAVKETLDKSIEDEEEQRWERERKEKREKRQKELQEAKEREQQELERLEKEMLLEEAVQSENKEETKEEIDIGKGKDNEQNKEEPKEENPLEKYMKMVLEAREKQQEKTSVRVDEGGMSPEDKSLFEEKDESIAAYSMKDEDDEFW